MNVALIFAGGSGIRMGAAVPKQFLEICGKTVLAHTLELFQSHPLIDGIWLVVAADQMERSRKLADECGISKLMGMAIGGDSAQASIYNGLVALSASCEHDTVVLIHDGVRPYVERQVISANIASVLEHGNAITFTPCYETIVISKDGKISMLEVNTTPGMTPTSFIPQQVKAAGLTMADVLTDIVENQF